MSFKKKFVKKFNDSIEFKGTFEDIKERINIEQYVKENSRNKNKKIKTVILSSILIIIMLFATIGLIGVGRWNEFQNKKVFSDLFYYPSSSNYIFIAKVEKKSKVKLYDGTGMKIPYTFYNMKQIIFLKGEPISNESKLCFYGVKFPFNLYVTYINNDMPTENSYYLFFTNTKSDENNRIRNIDFIIKDNDQKILLDGYDETKSLDEQNETIKEIINRYKSDYQD